MGEISVTLKGPESRPKAMDGTWFVFRGTPSEVRSDIIETFGLTDTGLSLHSVAINAAGVVRGTVTVATELSAEVISEEKGGWDNWPDPTGNYGGKAKPAEPELTREQQLVEQINRIDDPEELKDFWIRNKDHFNEEVTNAWKARGRSIS